MTSVSIGQVEEQAMRCCKAVLHVMVCLISSTLQKYILLSVFGYVSPSSSALERLIENSHFDQEQFYTPPHVHQCYK